ncbi:MAG: histone deacetylase [Thermodesulfobacteriota bacterium]
MSATTAVLMDRLFLEHDPGYDHVERPERLSTIYQALEAPENREGLFFPEFAPARYEDLCLNHTPAYVERVAETAGKQFDVLDPDTHTSPQSYDAACLAAGAVIEGLKLVASGQAKNAAALVRPPGHHAEAGHSSGFCLFNNIAIGARYGLKHLGMERILIVDWDLHHGNGTQHSFEESDQVLYFSTHQSPCFPGTGGVGEVGRGTGEGYTVNVPLPGGQHDDAFARIFNELLTPVARQYKPDCIMISAGYDIYFGDPLGGMTVTKEGFAYLARVLAELAEELCGGRLVLALEGGYNLAGIREGMLATLAEMAGRSLLPAASEARLRQAAPPLIALERAVAAAKKYWTF